MRTIAQMSAEEFLKWVDDRRSSRKVRLGKTPKTTTVNALATAWRVERTELEKLIIDIADKKVLTSTEEKK